MRPHAPRVQRMFGGTAFLVRENLVVGTMREGLLVRIGPDAVAEALENPFAEQMRMGGRLMAGWVFVSEDGCAEEADLRAWVDRGLAFCATLPPAAAKSSAKPGPKPAASRSQRKPAS